MANNEQDKINQILLNIDNEYYMIVKDILENDEFKKRLNYHHHENKSVFLHSLMVSIYSYKITKKLNWDYKSAAIGGLLHDFYYNDWQTTSNKNKPFFKKHGFVHAKEAKDNSKLHFDEFMNEKIEDIILKHMFPLNIKPPKYKESWVINIVDKYCSLEILKSPKNLPKYLGLNRKES